MPKCAPHCNFGVCSHLSHSTEKLYSSGTIPIYPLSIYARDNPPSAQPMLGVSIEEGPLRGPPPRDRVSTVQSKHGTSITCGTSVTT